MEKNGIKDKREVAEIVPIEDITAVVAEIGVMSAHQQITEKSFTALSSSLVSPIFVKVHTSLMMR